MLIFSGKLTFELIWYFFLKGNIFDVIPHGLKLTVVVISAVRHTVSLPLQITGNLQSIDLSYNMHLAKSLTWVVCWCRGDHLDLFKDNFEWSCWSQVRVLSFQVADTLTLLILLNLHLQVLYSPLQARRLRCRGPICLTAYRSGVNPPSFLELVSSITNLSPLVPRLFLALLTSKNRLGPD